MRRKISLVAIISAAILQGCSTPGQVQQENLDKYQAQTIESIKSCASVSGKADPLESFITVSTASCFHEVHGILKFKWDDQFIRAFVSKETGQTSLQIYTSFYSQDWAFPYSANFLINGQLQTETGTRIASDVDCSMSSTYGYCFHNEHFGFDIAADDLFIEARRLKAEGKLDFVYRINNKATGDRDKKIHVNEILGVQAIIESL